MQQERFILTYHHQFDSLRIDGLACLYSVLDELRYQPDRYVKGFVFGGGGRNWSEYMKEESRVLIERRKSKKIPWLEGRRLLPEIESRICMVIDVSDGHVYRLGFPKRDYGKLWFPVLSKRMISTTFYQHVRALKRPL